MSVKVMSLVWDNFHCGGTEKLAMLAMADWCNDDGGSLHPSHDAVARKCCISRSQAVRVVRSLVDGGWLMIVGNQFGGAPGTTKQYRVNVSKLRETGSTHATGSVDATGSNGATPDVNGRVAPMRETGSTDATQTTSEPSVNQTTPLPPTPDKQARFDPAAIDLPSSIPTAAWVGWVAYRRGRKLTCAEPTMRAQVAKLAEWHSAGHSPQQIIDDSITNGWQGLFEPKARGSPPVRKGRAPTAVENYAAQAAAARGEGNARSNPAERDITGDCTRVA